MFPRILSLGWLLRYLRSVSEEGARYGGERFLQGALDDIINICKEIQITPELITDIENIKRDFDDKFEGNKKLNKEYGELLAEHARDWKNKINNELKNKKSVSVDLQSGLDTDELIKISEQKPSELIPEMIYNKLTDIEKSDYSDAAKCLILGTSTPSAMVALRGAEATIGNFYKHKTGNDPGEKTWRQMTKELKDNAQNLGIEDTFIGFLDYIGDAKRNFAQHPNKIYSLREAVVIFMQVIAMVEDVYSKI